jgi:hypothetical protein
MTKEKPARRVNFTRRDAVKFLGAGAAATLTAELSPGADLPQEREVRRLLQASMITPQQSAVF